MKIRILVSVILAVALALSGCGVSRNDGLPAMPSRMAFAAGEKIPAFKLKGHDGSYYSTELFARSRLTLLFLWTTY